MTKRTSFSYKLSQKEQGHLSDILRKGNYRPLSIPHTSIAAETEKCKIALYNSGKCVVQGANAEDFVTFILEPNVLQSVEIGYENIISPELYDPHMGVDESGKGDFFGPLVTVCAYVDKNIVEKLKEMDVKDSKRITSDEKALRMGKDLRVLLRNRHAVVKIGPESYNRLYTKMRNVNSILAWAHSRAIENLLEINPDCPRVVIDQFAGENEVKKALMKKGQKVKLVQKHRAESDPAVAAASVIARELFLRSLKDMAEKYKTRIPKGASVAVRKTAEELVKKMGAEVLVETAKCHFKTTDQVLEATGHTREDIGAHGQAVSKPYSRKK